jgi:pimeloyl-ACP methyl ester carboxylesterase
MTFDFRGHGESKIINPEKFWNYPPNAQFSTKKPDLKKRTIDIKDFRANYLPYLVADLVAARQDIDNRNDSGGCNSSNIVLIGAEEGAAVGMMWLASEYFRESIHPVNTGRLPNSPPVPLIIAEGLRFDRAAGEDIAGAIWLSYTRSPNRITFPHQAVRTLVPRMREQIPMWFAHGAEDTVAAADATYLYEQVLQAHKLKDKTDFTSKYAIPKTKLRGASLLGKPELNVEETIEKFLKKMVDRRPNEAKKIRNANAAAPYYIPLQLLGFNANTFP